MFAGTWTLIKLILRRDRLKLPLWIVLVVGFTLGMVPLLKNTYGDEATLTTLYQTFQGNSAGLFMTGMMDDPTFGALFTIETVLWVGLAVAFMNTLLVIRHTRQNEETGAQELILSGRVSHQASLIAILIVAFVVNLLIALGLGAGLSADSALSTSGAWLYSLAMGLFGFTFAAIAAVVAQLTQSARTANGILAGIIGASFLVRGVGDILSRADTAGITQPHWLSNLSPFGWMQATRSLTLEYWWPLAIPVVFSAVVIPAAFWLLSRRDVGAGILPGRKGRARASKFLKTPLGFTWYLQKNVFIGWLLGALALALTVGVLVPEMIHVYDSSPALTQFIAAVGGVGTLIPVFLSVMLSFVAVLALAYIVQGLGRLRNEEASGYLENVLATKLSRFQWLALHFTTVMFGGAVILTTSGALLAVCVNLVSDLNVSVGDYLLAGLSYWPMLFVFGGIYTFLFGIAPRAAGLITWTYYAFVAFMSWLGPMLGLDRWVMDMSVMAHIAIAPASEVAYKPLLVMLTVGAGLSLAGLAAFRRRNLSTK